MPIPDLRRLFRVDRGARTVDRDLDEELRFHFDMTVEELLGRGMRPDEARRAAERRFGDGQASPLWHAPAPPYT